MIRDATDEELVAFHQGIYWDAFAAQHEPLEVWQRARRGEMPYGFCLRVAGTDGGIVFERYPESNCGLLTYMVVAPHARGRGLGKRLVDDALAVLAGTRAVFGEINDPERQTREPVEQARQRLARFERWGAKLVDVDYVQPALGPGLKRDTTLRLIAWGDPDAQTVGEFLDEFTRSLRSEK
jgi:GNAT superfamily N-acetyltransferase